MNKRILSVLQLPVWLAAFGFTFLIQIVSGRLIDYSSVIVSESIILGLWFIGNFYVFYTLLVPKLLRKKKTGVFILCLIIYLVISPLVIDSAIALNKLFFSIPDPDRFTIWSYLGGLFGAFITGSLGSSYRFMIDWFNDQQKKAELENKNLESELKLLKAKLNPHFLFNTINNIDTLIRESPRKASELLSKLSDLLRYVIYNTEADRVGLNEEINIIMKYIELQQIRISNPENIHMNIRSDDSPCRIPQMLFIPFIENAFKHSDLNKPDQSIHIGLEWDGRFIRFACSNNISNRDDQVGIGLDLIRKKLELFFPQKYVLDVEQKENIYSVNLNIDMSETPVIDNKNNIL